MRKRCLEEKKTEGVEGEIDSEGHARRGGEKVEELVERRQGVVEEREI